MSGRGFIVVPAIHGYDVIDEWTGHPVAHSDYQHVADGLAADLRKGARWGSRELVRSLLRDADDGDL